MQNRVPYCVFGHRAFVGFDVIRPKKGYFLQRESPRCDLIKTMSGENDMESVTDTIIVLW